ncbi:MAG TPA: Crp/Fnr family transcriptional regulator [Tepidisphaeraceae bacterium]|jgi:CRP-like cAMP-binding protein|nr:Crp/Fnr family transcriptional regulator [Tepidisphaeraceae bacterium]
MSHILENGAILDLVRQHDAGGRRLDYSDGQAVFEPKDPATDLFVVESGEIRLFEVAPQGARRLLDILGPERCFGFASIGRIPAYEKLAVSVGDSAVRAIPADRLREILLSHGEIAMSFAENMARELHEAWSEGSHFVFEDCRLRLIKTLLRFSQSPAARIVPEGIELHMTHAQLAQAVGAARETVSLCLTQLRQENLVRTSRNRVVYDPNRLRQIVPNDFAAELALAG